MGTFMTAFGHSRLKLGHEGLAFEVIENIYTSIYNENSNEYNLNKQ